MDHDSRFTDIQQTCGRPAVLGAQQQRRPHHDTGQVVTFLVQNGECMLKTDPMVKLERPQFIQYQQLMVFMQQEQVTPVQGLLIELPVAGGFAVLVRGLERSQPAAGKGAQVHKIDARLAAALEQRRGADSAHLPAARGCLLRQFHAPGGLARAAGSRQQEELPFLRTAPFRQEISRHQ